MEKPTPSLWETFGKPSEDKIARGLLTFGRVKHRRGNAPL